jgi:transposase-like protein
MMLVYSYSFYGVYMDCMKCGSTDHRKNGVIRGKQRYRCVSCGYNFTNTHGRGKPLALRLQALKLYTENVGIRSISRLLEVSPGVVVRLKCAMKARR